jgi:hypothetical protein
MIPTKRKKLRQCRIPRIVRWGAGLVTIDFEVSGETPMKVNDKAPDFTLQDETGADFALKDLRGKTVVLFFYPRANTPG